MPNVKSKYKQQNKRKRENPNAQQQARRNATAAVSNAAKQVKRAANAVQKNNTPKQTPARTQSVSRGGGRVQTPSRVQTVRNNNANRVAQRNTGRIQLPKANTATSTTTSSNRNIQSAADRMNKFMNGGNRQQQMQNRRDHRQTYDNSSRRMDSDRQQLARKAAETPRNVAYKIPLIKKADNTIKATVSNIKEATEDIKEDGLTPKNAYKWGTAVAGNPILNNMVNRGDTPSEAMKNFAKTELGMGSSYAGGGITGVGASAGILADAEQAKSVHDDKSLLAGKAYLKAIGADNPSIKLASKLPWNKWVLEKVDDYFTSAGKKFEDFGNQQLADVEAGIDTKTGKRLQRLNVMAQQMSLDILLSGGGSAALKKGASKAELKKAGIDLKKPAKDWTPEEVQKMDKIADDIRKNGPKISITVPMGFRSGGSEYNNAKDKGATEEEARLSAEIAAGLAVGTEYATNKGIFGDVAGKGAVEKIEEVANGKLASAIKVKYGSWANAPAKAIIEEARVAVGEAFEEALEGFLSPIAQNKIYNERLGKEERGNLRESFMNIAAGDEKEIRKIADEYGVPEEEVRRQRIEILKDPKVIKEYEQQLIEDGIPENVAHDGAKTLALYREAALRGNTELAKKYREKLTTMFYSLNPYEENTVFGNDPWNDKKQAWKDIGEQAAYGGTLGGAFNVPYATVRGIKRANARGKMTTEDINALIENVSNSDDNVASAIAQSIKKNIDNGKGMTNEQLERLQDEQAKQAHKNAVSYIATSKAVKKATEKYVPKTGVYTVTNENGEKEERAGLRGVARNNAVNATTQVAEVLSNVEGISEEQIEEAQYIVGNFAAGEFNPEFIDRMTLNHPENRTAYESVFNETLPETNEGTRKFLFNKAIEINEAIAKEQTEQDIEELTGATIQFMAEEYSAEAADIADGILQEKIGFKLGSKVSDATAETLNNIQDYGAAINAVYLSARVGESIDEESMKSIRKLLTPEEIDLIEQQGLRDSEAGVVSSSKIEVISDTEVDKTILQQATSLLMSGTTDKVVFVDHIGRTEDGKPSLQRNSEVSDTEEKIISQGYNKDGAVVIALDSKDPITQLLGHEDFHNLMKWAGDKGKEYLDAGKEWLVDAGLYDEYMEEYKNLYKNEIAGKSEEEAEYYLLEEIFANHTFEMIQSDAFINRLSERAPELLKDVIKMLNHWIRACRALVLKMRTNSDGKYELWEKIAGFENLARKYADAYAEAMKNKAEAAKADYNSRVDMPADIAWSITESENNEYMKAAEEGNNYKCRTMLEDAANRKMLHFPYYHGSMNAVFTVFDKSKANVEGNSGAGFYFSSDYYDSEGHYADKEGTDNYLKRSALANRLLDAGKSPDGEIITTYERAYEVATDMLDKEPGVYEVALRYNNPYTRDYSNSTNIYDDILEDAIMDVPEDMEEMEDYDNEEDYFEDLYIRRDEYIAERIEDAVYGAMRDLENMYDVVDSPWASDLLKAITQSMYEDKSLTWDSILDCITNAGSPTIIENESTGEEEYADTELTRLIIENFGYDAVVDEEVGHKFGQLSRSMSYGTVHVIVFSPNQIKSLDPITRDDDGNIIPLDQRLNDNEDDIRWSMYGKRARTAQRKKMEEAEKMFASGKYTQAEIQEKTGYKVDTDGKAKFELSDKGMKLFATSAPSLSENEILNELRKIAKNNLEEYKKIQKGENGRVARIHLGEIIQHDVLFENYPWLKFTPVKVCRDDPGTTGTKMLGKGTKGETVPLTDGSYGINIRASLSKEQFLDTLLHEIQHVIQEHEDFSKGSSSERWNLIRQNLKNRFDYLTAKMNNDPSYMSNPINATDYMTTLKLYNMSMASEVGDNMDVINDRAAYKATKGEFEARETVSRRKKSQQELNKDQRAWDSTGELRIEDFENYDIGGIFDTSSMSSRAKSSKSSDDKTLLAVHNTTYQKLMRAFDLGGLPAPSIAIIDAEAGHTGYGPVSLLFDKSTIDPKEWQNDVWDRDAWTPEAPWIQRDINDEKFEQAINTLLKYHDEENLKNYRSMLAVYAEKDMNDKKSYFKHAISDESQFGSFEQYINALAGDASVQDVFEWETDKEEYSKKDVVEWLNGIFDGVVSDEYITNPDGEKVPVTLDNVVDTMFPFDEPINRLDDMLFENESLAKSVIKSYNSIEEIQADRDRLKPNEESRDDYNLYKKWLYETAKEIGEDNSLGRYRSFPSVLADVFLNYGTERSDIELGLKEFGYGDIKISDRQWEDLEYYVEKLRNISVPYFEAKPRTGLGWSDVKAAMVPASAPGKIIKGLEERGIKVYFYNEDRVGEMNEVGEKEDLKWSRAPKTPKEPTQEEMKAYNVKKSNSKQFGGNLFSVHNPLQLQAEDNEAATIKTIKSYIEARDRRETPEERKARRDANMAFAESLFAGEDPEEIQQKEKAKPKKELNKLSIKDDALQLAKLSMLQSESGKQFKHKVAQHIEAAIAKINAQYNNGDYDAMAETAYETAVYAISQSEISDIDEFYQYVDLRDYLSKHTIKLNDDIDFRSRNQGRLKMSEDGTSIETVYKDIYNKIIGVVSGNAETPAEMYEELEQALDRLTPQAVAMTSDDFHSLVTTMANHIASVAMGEEVELKRGRPGWVGDTYAIKEKKLKLRIEEEQYKEEINNNPVRKQDIEDKRKKLDEAELHSGGVDNKITHGALTEVSIIDLKTKSAERLEKLLRDENTPREFKPVIVQLLSCINDKQSTYNLYEDIIKEERDKKTGKLVYDKLGSWAAVATELAALNNDPNNGFMIHNNVILDLNELGTKKLDGIRYPDKVERAVDAVIHGIEYENKPFDERNTFGPHDNANAMVEEFRAYGKKHKHGSLKDLFHDRFNLGLLSAIDFFDIIGGRTNELFKTWNRGMDTQVKLFQLVRKRMEEIAAPYDKTKFGVHGASQFDDWQKSGKPLDFLGKKLNEDEIIEFTGKRGNTIKLTYANAMEIAFYMDRPAARRHLIDDEAGNNSVKRIYIENGKGSSVYWINKFLTGHESAGEGQWVEITPADIDYITSRLSPQQREVMLQMGELMGEVTNYAREAYDTIYGIDMFPDDNHLGVRFVGDNETKNDTGKNNAENPVQNDPGFLNEVDNDNDDNKNSGKSVDTGQVLIIGNFFEDSAYKISELIKIAAYKKAEYDFKRAYNMGIKEETDDENVVKISAPKLVIRESYTNGTADYISEFMKDLDDAFELPDKGWEAFVQRSIANYKKSVIGFGPRVMLQQPTAIIRAYSEINPKYINYADLRHTRSLYKEMMEHSPIAVWKSYGFNDVDLAHSLTDILMNKEFSLYDRYTMGVYGGIDLYGNWTLIWNGVKREVADIGMYKQGTNEYWEAVNERFTDIINKTQVVDSPFNRVKVMRNPTSFIKMTTAFMSEPLKTIAIWARGYQKAVELAREGDKSGAAKQVAKTTTVVMINFAFVSAFAAVWDATKAKLIGDDEDKEKSWQRLWWEHFRLNLFNNNANIFNNIPILSDIITQAMEGYKPGNMALDGWAGLAESSVKLFTDDKHTTSYKVRKVVDNLGYVTGVPAKNVWTTFDVIYHACVSLAGASTGPEPSRLDVVVFPTADNSKKSNDYGVDSSRKKKKGGNGKKSDELLDINELAATEDRKAAAEFKKKRKAFKLEDKPSLFDKMVSSLVGYDVRFFRAAEDDDPSKIWDTIIPLNDNTKLDNFLNKRNIGLSKQERKDKERIIELNDVITNAAKKKGTIDERLWKTINSPSQAHFEKTFEEAMTSGDYKQIKQMRKMFIDAGGNEKWINKKIRKKIRDGKTSDDRPFLRKLAYEGNFAQVEKIKDLYLTCNGTEETFNATMLKATTDAYKKTIGKNWKIDAQESMRTYLNDNGMSDASISRNILCKSDTAKTFKEQCRLRDWTGAAQTLADLMVAGITDQDINYLWDNRNKYVRKDTYADGVYAYPADQVYPVKSEFGHRSSPGNGGSTDHQGIDIGMDGGTKVKAVDGGKVELAGWNGGYGNCVIIDHGGGTKTYYGHLKNFSIQTGDFVQKGDYIGRVDSTGNSTGNHLHLGFFVNGEFVDPREYMDL